MNNIRQSKALDLIIDDAYCASGKQQIRLDKFECPTLESRATLYPKNADKKYGMIVMDCDELRSHYRKYFNVFASDWLNDEYPQKTDIVIGWNDDDDNHWGDEYLETGNDEIEDYHPVVSPTPNEYQAWKLQILNLIKSRFEVIEHAKNNSN